MPTPRPAASHDDLLRWRRARGLERVLPRAQALLFEHLGERAAADGARVDVWRHELTRRQLVVSADGRAYEERGGHLVACSSPEPALWRVLPSAREWLELGGYGSCCPHPEPLAA